MIIQADMRDALFDLDANSVDSVVTDPPYHLTSVVKRFGSATAAPAQHGTDGAFARASKGFMGKTWDGGDIAFRADTWKAVLRVLKPGGYLVAFAATRNSHRMVCAIEDAGFEVRDALMWIYGTGMPKSHCDREGRGTALKPAYEPICLARKPLSEKTIALNIARWGTGDLEIDGCRIETDEDRRRPSSGGENGLAGTSTFKIRARKVEEQPLTSGRWPANVVHDGSDEVVAMFPDSDGQQGDLKATGKARPTKTCFGDMAPPLPHAARNDSGSAARFFYSAKASKHDRAGSNHPTVKPVSLMRWLVKLVTPPGGTVLDPFAGSGTTATAAALEGFDYVAIERDPVYAADIRRRLGVSAPASAPSLDDLFDAELYEVDETGI